MATSLPRSIPVTPSKAQFTWRPPMHTNWSQPAICFAPHARVQRMTIADTAGSSIELEKRLELRALVELD